MTDPGRGHRPADPPDAAPPGAEAPVTGERPLVDQLAALRRLGELVARGVDRAAVFDAVVAEAYAAFQVQFTALLKYQADGVAHIVALHNGPPGLAIGERAPHLPGGLVLRVFHSGRPVRVAYSDVPLHEAARLHELGITAGVAAPILVDGALWGVLAGMSLTGVVAPGLEHRIADFAEIAATAVAAAHAKDDVRGLKEEQDALHRVAELAALGSDPGDVFRALAVEVAALRHGCRTMIARFDPDGAITVVAVRGDQPEAGNHLHSAGDGLAAAVRQSGQAARIDGYSTVPASEATIEAASGAVRTGVGVPINVEGEVWGVLAMTSDDRLLPPDTERRLSQFAEIAAIAILTAKSRADLHRMATEQAALRRVAELVAQGVPQHDLFAAVATEASRLIKQETTLLRVEADGTYAVIAACGSPATLGTRITVADDDEGLIPKIVRTRRPARLDDYTARPGHAYARDRYGVRSGVGAPVIVDDRLWGILGATSSDGRKLPADTEQRLAEFAGLVAGALANAQSRADLQQLADEQTALRAVAELVAQAVPPEDIFAAVTVEASRLLAGTPMTLTRFGHDSHLVVLATHRGPAPIGTRIDYQPGTLPDRARLDGVAVRVDDYTHEPDAQLAVEYNMTAAVSVPIFVGGQVWGMLTATSDARPLAAGTEQRLVQFTGLITAAVANVQTRIELRSLADEQAALRSVAELAAQGAPAEEVLGAVARQASRLTGVDFSTLVRYEMDGSTEIVALDGAPPGVAVGMRAPGSGDGSLQRVWRTHRPARVDNLAGMSGRWPQVAHGHGFSTSAAVPILSQGTLWGSLVVVGRDKPLPAEIHVHLTNFAELTGTAIAAAQARRELQQLADEQGALRRVAELVARGAALPEVFTAVAVEASHLLGHLAAALLRYDEAAAAVVVAACNSPAPIGLRIPPTPGTGTGEVRSTGKPFRVDRFADTGLAEMATELGVAAGVAVPITVEGRVWGALISSSPDGPLPAGTEDRLTPFAELAAAAIANAENKEKLTASRARVVATADETRRRLQRDVHDSAQQRLVHSIIILKLARNAIATGRSAAELVDEALGNAERANRDLRDVVHGILPEALTRGGLNLGLESLVADFSLPIRLRTAVPRLPADLETTAYFIVAEALANVIKHAHAQNAAVELAVDGDHLDIQVNDDGAGGADPQHGSGLTGLQDRVEASNGSLVLTSPAGKGTTLHARLPIPQRS